MRRSGEQYSRCSPSPGPRREPTRYERTRYERTRYERTRYDAGRLRGAGGVRRAHGDAGRGFRPLPPRLPVPPRGMAAGGGGLRVSQAVTIPVTMNDGVVISTEVVYPPIPATGALAPGKFPVLLTQNPYGDPAS